MRLRNNRRKSPVDYILPFLILVCIGVIAVIGFQLWSNWDKHGKGDVYFYVAQGKAKILPYGETDWDNAFSGTKLLLGDSLKTSSPGRVVIEFFNGTIVRMGPDSAITLTDLIKSSDQETMVFNLDNGSLWVAGEKSEGVREARYEVRTSHLLVKATGTVFEVESGSSETVRVFDGEVNVDVMIGEAGKERVAQTINVEVGQEITVDAAALSAFEQNQSPSVLKAVSDSFKSTEWFVWNTREDASPTDFASSASMEEGMTQPFMMDGSQESGETEEGLADTQESTESEDADSENDQFGSDEIAKPVITSPTEKVTTTGKATIAGTVSSGTAKVVVVSTIEGKEDSYTLSKFSSGDTSWSYNVAEALGNMKAGANLYEVYAYDSEGNKSDPASITITYEKDAAAVTGDLAAPKVLTFNGAASSTVTTDTVKVAGSVEGAAKVVVNGYTLSAFQAGSTSWSYTAKESLGNLVPGANEYEVYAVDPDGNKSEVVKFTITYTKAAGTSDTSTQETTSSGTTQQPVYGF
ncbi:MAG TPA: FecR domain-containing protein [Candidatus Gracilibacteria bacterium]|nr:FecR domain-containing protein [Candidatus Gracilibacteria bacterium]